jgi:primosomal protein N'
MEKLTIRSVPQIFEDVIIDGITKHESYDDIRDRVVTVFRDEVMGQMKWRLKVDDLDDAPQTPENEEIVLKITEQAKKKWTALRRMCNRYKQTLNLLADEDLATIWDDEDSDESWDGDEKTAEWPELATDQE